MIHRVITSFSISEDIVSYYQPEISLWAAAIDNALHDIEFYVQNNYLTNDFYDQSRLCDNATDAFNWIHAHTTTKQICSLPWACSMVFPLCYEYVVDYYRKLTADCIILPPKIPKGYLNKVGKHGLIPNYKKQLKPNLIPFSDDPTSRQSVFVASVCKEPCSNLEEVLERCNQSHDHNQHIPSYLPSILQFG